jgi:PAS domain S-box-containing protein
METGSGVVDVLHVDDEPEFAETAATLLEREDERFEVETATSAAEGLDRLADDGYHCVVSDYDMPGRSGIEFLEAVRETYPTLPFILYTGMGSEEVASDAISAGATDYLQKGSGTGQYKLLANRIDNAISQARSQQAQRHLRELAENTNQILYIFSNDWSELQFINAAYEDIWGRSVEALQDDPTDFLNGIHPDDRACVREAMERISGGETIQLEYRVNPADDYERWVDVRGEPIVNETGEVVRVAGLAIDITEHKRNERELQRERDRVEEFTAVVSHDIRNPLRLADGRLELAREECDSEHLDVLGDALDRMDRIIEDMLCLAREERQIGAKEPISLHDAVDAAWDVVAHAADGVDLPHDVDDQSLPTIEADDDRLQQLLENLLSNAIEHGGPDVTVTVGRLDDGFYVADDGPGTPPDDHEEVFTTGYTTAEEGTGFGLRIVEQAAEAHGWDVDVTDGSAGGARFEITGVEFAE